MDIHRVLHYQGLLFISEIIWTELINRHDNNTLVKYIDINKIKKLICQKYYWPSLKKDVKAYFKSCNICLALKAVKHKLFNNLQVLLIPTYQLKHLLIDFVTQLQVLTNWKGKIYDSILVIVNWLTKIVDYKPIKITINALC